MPQDVRFTPDEIRELTEKGLLKQEDLALLHPADQQVAQQLLVKPPQVGPIDLPSEGPRPMMDRFLSGAMGQQLPSDVPSALGALTTALPIGFMATKLAKFALPGGAPPAAPSFSTAPTGTALGGAKVRMDGFSLPHQMTSTTTPNAARPPALRGARPQGVPSNVTSSGPGGVSGLSTGDMAERMGKGVTNDFRGRVTFDKSASAAGPGQVPPKLELPPGATLRTPPAEFKQLMDAYAEAQGDPQQVEALRQYISQLLRK
jgi:hypothetical protein